MPGLEDVTGAFAFVQSFLIYSVVSQAVSALMSPAFNALQQDALKAHPNMVITPDILARAVVGDFMARAAAEGEAARSGIDADRFDIYLKLADYRLAPADLAEAVLRSYLGDAEAKAEARKQGVTPARFDTLKLLAGDAIGPQQAAEALRRGLIDEHGKGPGSTSYDQAIAESRLHNKWGPVLFELTRAILSPPDAASAVVRGFLPLDKAEALAALSGVDTGAFRTMVQLAADAPSPTELATALRRGVIPEDSGSPDKPGFVQGIEQGRLGNKWTDMIKALAQEWPTPTDALEARLVGQVSTTESKALYERFGGDPKFYQLLLDTRGEAPTPLELGVLLNRGVIDHHGLGPDKTSFDQGFHEGRWRNKWLPVYDALRQFRSPESTITLFLSHGVITDEEAADEFSKLGMDEATIKRYMDEAHLEAFSEYRGITASAILQAYHDQILTRPQALQILTALHVDERAANILLELQDINRAFEAVQNALSRIRTLYAGRKITQQTAKDSLIKLGIEPTQVDPIVKSWQIENSVSVKVLTQAEITDAFKLGFLDEAEALTELENIGYTPFDAWILLSLKEKALVSGRPAKGPAPPQDQVIPGTT
jgi:hypothetical protein